MPAGLADPRAFAGGVFDAIASLYDRARPGYPAPAVAELVSACGIGPSSRVLEVGCGTGQLTRDLAPTGARVTCVEPGRALAETATANLATFADVEVIDARFEDLDVPAGSIDVVVSATAFHWIDPEVSFAKAARMLRTGGHLALLTNTHAAGGTHTEPAVNERLKTLHRRLAPEVGDWTFPPAEDIEAQARAGGDIAAVWARVERKLSEPPGVGHLFDPPRVHAYPWLATYDTDGYLAMLASQSSYALMEPARRQSLLAAIAEVIDRHLGGTVTKEYVTVVALARRRPAAMPGEVVVGADDPRRDDVATLLETHLAWSRSETPPGYSFAVEVDALVEPSVSFFSARSGGELVGVAALRHLDDHHVELKSMYTRAERRRQGVGVALVRTLLAEARRRGYRRMSLETGTSEAFAPARSLYADLGFRPCGAFGDYSPSPHNTFMTIHLDPSDLDPSDLDPSDTAQSPPLDGDDQ
ncbi:MAG TPA: GNAT family N-acetyltransferase [Acidimicrobiales bacterium]|nr:GNAT family N-acetyltransferase [Acidimicrobiales bacterium]